VRARLERGRAVTGIVAVFALSRLAAHWAGVRFDTSSLGTFWQYPDPAFLRSHLLQTLYYSHDQPPLFGLFIGVVLKLAPHEFTTVMHAAYIALGLIATLALFTLLKQLGLSERVSGLVAIAFALTPATLIYENWFFYEYPTMTLLLCAAVALHRFLSRDSLPAGIAFFTLMAAVVYTRSVFQGIWMLAIIAMLLLLTKHRRLILIACAVPLLAVGLLYLKNAVVFGTPTTSSWMGMNLARETVAKLTPADRHRLVRQGKLHRVSLTRPFMPLADYASSVPAARPTGIAVLDQRVKPGGQVNYNNKTYIAISKAYLTDALWVVRHEPHVYLGSVQMALKISMQPSTNYDYVQPNRSKLRRYTQFVDDYVYLRAGPVGMGFGIIAAYFFAATYLVAIITRLAERIRKPDPATVTLLFIGLTAAYAYTVSSLTEIGENNRMRFFLDPLVLVLVAHGMRAVVGRVRALVRLRDRGHAVGSTGRLLDAE
jgi:hypothetical protein